jgi:excisionase family DNA binding protein
MDTARLVVCVSKVATLVLGDVSLFSEYRKMTTNILINFYKVDDVAELLGLAPGTIRRMLRERSLGFVRFGRSIRIPEHEIERLLNSGKVEAVVQ